MSDFDLKYTIDNTPVSAKALIEKASFYNEVYRKAWLKPTSEAARILRSVGFEVEYNYDYWNGDLPRNSL